MKRIHGGTNAFSVGAASKAEKDRKIDQMKEYRKIEGEFNILAGEVYRLDKKDREDLVNIVETIVKETVKRKAGMSLRDEGIGGEDILIEEKENETPEETRERNEREEMEKEEREERRARNRRIKKEKCRIQWRRVLADSNPPPPPGHIMFRPVDDRWMKSQCYMIGMIYTLNEYDAPSIIDELRGLSSLCEVETAPAHEDIIYVDGDGNCLFRALAWWVTGSEEQHGRMRRRIVHFMMRFPEEFGARMTGPEGQLYTKEGNDRMFTEGEWGTQCEIYGAATLLGVDIYTFREGRWMQYRPLFEWSYFDGFKVTRPIGPNERTRCALYLTADACFHYDVVRHMKSVAPKCATCFANLG